MYHLQHPGLDLKADVQDIIRQIDRNRTRSVCSKVVIIGDFNLDLQTQEQLSSVMLESGLHQLITEPTHELGSVLDLLYTDLEGCTVHNIPVWFSDHHIISMQIQ